MTTSQCSKSHPSRRMVSLGGRLLQLGDESRSEDVAGWVAKHRTPAPGDGATDAGRRLAAAASGRRSVGRRRDAAAAGSGKSAARERRSARDDAVAMAAAKP